LTEVGLIVEKNFRVEAAIKVAEEKILRVGVGLQNQKASHPDFY
jgi:hypothetical protein